MSKHAAVAIVVLCFVCTFLTMIYQYGSRGWKHEQNIPGGGHGHHSASHSESQVHATPSATPGGAVMTPMATDTTGTPAPVSATPASATPAASHTP